MPFWIRLCGQTCGARLVKQTTGPCVPPAVLNVAFVESAKKGGGDRKRRAQGIGRGEGAAEEESEDDEEAGGDDADDDDDADDAVE
eukprot:1994222-Pyramimonas_sp.AAC.1